MCVEKVNVTRFLYVHVGEQKVQKLLDAGVSVTTSKGKYDVLQRHYPKILMPIGKRKLRVK